MLPSCARLGWPQVAGVEGVRVVLAFDVLEAPTGSVLVLRDIVVR